MKILFHGLKKIWGSKLAPRGSKRALDSLARLRPWSWVVATAIAGGLPITPYPALASSINQTAHTSSTHRAVSDRDDDWDDDDKEKNTKRGPTGPTGPIGPVGPVGPVGPAGVSGYETVDGPPVEVPPFQFSPASASCPAGKSPLGGGYRIVEVFLPLNNVSVYRNQAVGSTWQVILRNNSPSIITLIVQVVCATV
jgi:hypothetical protein